MDAGGLRTAFGALGLRRLNRGRARRLRRKLCGRQCVDTLPVQELASSVLLESGPVAIAF
jgi:hypothetical protein